MDEVRFVLVVSNTSPIIKLAAIGQLDLLRQLYTTIVIPAAVYNEIVVSGYGQPGSHEVATEPWFVRHDVTAIMEVHALLGAGLGRGEAEAIILADEQHASLLLIDEKRGRQVATSRSLALTGLLGVLLAAKRSGLISAVRPLLDALRMAAGFRVSPAVYASVLALAGE
jgi:predicted nucleic acid-binding protein